MEAKTSAPQYHSDPHIPMQPFQSSAPPPTYNPADPYFPTANPNPTVPAPVPQSHYWDNAVFSAAIFLGLIFGFVARFGAYTFKSSKIISYFGGVAIGSAIAGVALTTYGIYARVTTLYWRYYYYPIAIGVLDLITAAFCASKYFGMKNGWLKGNVYTLQILFLHSLPYKPAMKLRAPAFWLLQAESTFELIQEHVGLSTRLRQGRAKVPQASHGTQRSA
ncbi:hypothetical protein BJ742DRAFT_868235 [Cladochytrium replicatum]|nr:hypothetical protein BJ742DRAFT_868235 [Cladochytrium replicatum]